jgi:uncharacterized protein (UPF0248 family)
VKIPFYFFLIFFLIGLASQTTHAQKQLVLLKKQKVILRLNPGDEIIYSLKGDKTIRKSYVNNLYDTAVLAHNTVVPLHRINRIYFKRSTFANVVGGLLVVGGAGFFVIDQFNTVVVQGGSASLDPQVTTISATALVIGLPMMLIHKKSQRIKSPYRILTVKEGSMFYQTPRKPTIE